MDVLIVGAGIAGPSLAYWLARAGWRPTIVESAPQLRRGGYLIDFWGAGLEVADRMGIVHDLFERGYRIRELRTVGRSGRSIASLDPQAIARHSSGRFVSIARGDLAAIVHDALDERVETILGDTVRSLNDTGDGVQVEFAGGTTRGFDLVIGADGLHSRVRQLAFGPESEFEKYLGICVAAFDVRGYRPRDELTAVMHADVGLQVIRMSMRDDVTMFFLTFRHEGALPTEASEQQELLRRRFAGAGWEVPAILRTLPDARTFYCDRVSQIRMPSWSRGRVALIGDAAAGVSLLAGQGSALAMSEAYVLAAELARADGDHARGFLAYERQLRGILLDRQRAAERLDVMFAPRDRRQLAVRNTSLRLAGLPWVGALLGRRTLYDPITLPSFPVRYAS